jgi:hypothetical protein
MPMKPQPLNALVLPRDTSRATFACREIANQALELHQRMCEFLEGRGSADELKLADQNLAYIMEVMPHLHRMIEERCVYDAGYKDGVLDAASDLPTVLANLSKISGTVTFVPIYRGGDLRDIFGRNDRQDPR